MVFRYEVNPQRDVNNEKSDNIRHQNLSKSSDWTDVPLEVPDDNVLLKKENMMINEDIPKPPPRKHKKGLREKIETVAKNSLQALNINNNYNNKKPIEEPLCVKDTIDYSCPCHDPNHEHNRIRNKHQKNKNDIKLPKNTPKLSEKIAKRRKNLSVVSLPNYTELKFSVANNDSKIDKNLEKRNSITSLPDEYKKLNMFKKDRARCRSFGSIFPNQLLEKLKHSKTPADVESDDSFGPLEDWDLKIIEHYNPKDTSLPRARKLPKTETEILNNIENMIVQEDVITKPIPPVRRSESLIKKMNRTTNESMNVVSTKNSDNKTPPPTPIEQNEQLPIIRAAQLPTEDEEGRVEHSSLMKILEEYSIKDKQRTQNDLNDINHLKKNNVNVNLNRPLNNQFVIESSSKKSLSNPVEEFLNAERTS